MTPLERITERVMRLGDPNDSGTPRPLLTVEEFFEGNTVDGSIGCNLEAAPSPMQFHALFQAIAQRPEVKDIRICITFFDDPDWPFTDTVYIMTLASEDEVRSWFPEELAPDSVDAGFVEGQPYERYTVPAGVRAVACWWEEQGSALHPPGGCCLLDLGIVFRVQT